MSDENWGYRKDSKQNENNDSRNIPEVFGDSNTIFTKKNHLYLYSEIHKQSAKEFISQLHDLENNLIQYSAEIPIYIHINSPGGIIKDSLAIFNNLLEEKKIRPVYMYVDSFCASAATFLLVIGTKRFMYENSFMMIHQLSAGAIGKYEEIKDTYKNVTLLMDSIKQIYFKYTNFPEKELEKILERDLLLQPDDCFKYGLIDKVV